MYLNQHHRLGTTLLFAFALSVSAHGQCETPWEFNRSLGHPGLAGEGGISSMLVFDPGDGPRLYTAGVGVRTFEGNITSAGWSVDETTNWGAIFSPEFGSFDQGGCMQAIGEWPGDGVTQPLLVSGGFTESPSSGAPILTIFDGTTLRVITLGDGNVRRHGIKQLLAFSGSGRNERTRMYVCGSYNGGTGVGYIDPATNYTTVRSINGPGEVGEALLVHDDGSGRALYVAAHMRFNGDGFAGAGLRNIGRYDGDTWSSVGGGLPNSGPVLGLGEFDHDGQETTRPVLVAVAENAVFLWNGSQWSSFESPGQLSGSSVEFNDGTGKAMFFASKNLPTSDPTPILYRLRVGDNSVEPVPGSKARFAYDQTPESYPHPARVFVQDLGAGSQLLVSGTFLVPNEHFSPKHLHAWTASGWADPGTRTPQNHPYRIFDLATFDPDSGGPLPEELYACGKPDLGYNPSDTLESIGSVGAWDGQTWRYTGQGLSFTTQSGRISSFVYALASGRFQNAPALFASATLNEFGFSSQLYRFNNNSWVPMDGAFEFPGRVDVIAGTINSRDELFAYGGVGVVRWDGATWVDVDPELPIFSNIPSAVVYNNGTSNALYVSAAEVISGSNVARWDGLEWTPFGQGLPELPSFLDHYDLFVAGETLFAVSSAISTARAIYRWQGTTWGDTLITVPESIVPIGVAHDGSEDLLFFRNLRHYSQGSTDVFAYSPGLNALAPVQQIGIVNAYMALPSLGDYGFVSSVANFTVNNQPGLCVAGMFTGVGGRFLTDDIDYNPTISGIPALSFAHLHCPGRVTCVADFNSSNTVTVDDIFEFLAAWFAHDSRANVNHVSGITVDDIFHFLSAWFAGC